MYVGRRFLFFCGIILLAIVLSAYYYITAHGFSARAKPLGFEKFIAENLRALSIPREAKRRANPLKSSPLIIAEARDHFADHCATCHGDNGDGKTLINDGLYPPAPDLRSEEVQSLSDGELLYIIENGIRFTGMPGFGGEDEENWKLVLFIRHLPKLTAEEIKLMEEVRRG